MAKRKNNIDDIDIVDDFELEDIDDFDPFDVLDDSYEDKKSYGNDKPRGGNASNKRNKNKKKNPVLVWAGRVGATLLSTILILVIFLYAVMAMLVYGPSKTAKIQFVLSVQETSAIGFLANWFCSQDEIDQIKANNAIKDTDEITDAGLVNIDTAAQDPETPDIEIVDVKEFIFNKGQNCKCCGVWKVYYNEQESVRTFARFKKCSEVYQKVFIGGRTLNQLTVNI